MAFIGLATLGIGSGPARAQAPACQGDPSGVRLHVVVEGARNARGLMTATLYGADSAKFLKDSGELTIWRVPAQPPSQDLCLNLPAAGDYAVAVYHDENSNHHFDRGGLFGQPTEAYGFSRNPHLFLGPPSLNAVKFRVGDGETTIHVKLHYP